MRTSRDFRILARLANWWLGFRRRLRMYEQCNLAEWQYWGTRRARRELGRCEEPDSAATRANVRRGRPTDRTECRNSLRADAEAE